MTSLTQMIDAFCSGRPGKDAYELLPAFLHNPPGVIEQFVDAVMATQPDGGTFLDAALSHMPEEAFDRLATKWLPHAATEGLTGAIEALVAYASLQRPAALSPYLDKLSEMDANGSSYYACWPWRASPQATVAELLEQARTGASTEERLQAFERLLETRQPAALQACASIAADIPVPHSIGLYLQEVGFDENQRQLFPDEVAHVIFPAAYLPAPHASWSLQGLHPSWHLPATSTGRFGGAGTGTCGLCGGKLHNLLEIPEKQASLSDSEQVVSLQACLSCLGWEKPVLYYRHGGPGEVLALDEGTCSPQFPAQGLRECTAELAPTPARWRWQDWALSNSRENLNRLGGHPTWVQGADYPDCPCCKKKMRFMLQLDSQLPDQDSEEWLWGSGGVAYGFNCATCRTTAYIWQCT
ncbi:hypothetical protein ASD58_03815 [Duganella sp. Root1480D1]|nr:hypothetical protein ASD58_03815 [Duganella sp. Root1480D1]